MATSAAAHTARREGREVSQPGFVRDAFAVGQSSAFITRRGPIWHAADAKSRWCIAPAALYRNQTRDQDAVRIQGGPSAGRPPCVTASRYDSLKLAPQLCRAGAAALRTHPVAGSHNHDTTQRSAADFKGANRRCGVCWGAVKLRMRSVQNIAKITSAMKMVAASKMRVAQAATENSRGISSPMLTLLGDHPGQCRASAHIVPVL